MIGGKERVGKAADYLKQAQECMDLADKMEGPARKKVIEWASAWLELAREEVIQQQSSTGPNRAISEKPH